MTRVLVTGADGFVGSHVVELLSQQTDWEIRTVDLGSSSEADWRARRPVDVVMSLAATADPGEALRAPEAAYVNGVRVMVQTLEYASRVGARVLHVSTNEVYGAKAGPVYAPRGPYAGAKACQEIVCGAYHDVPTQIVVTQSLFGERQQPNKLVPTAIRNLLAGAPITLQRNGTKWASRPFLHVRNLAEALVFLVQAGGGARRVHVGADETLSVRLVVDVLADVLDCEPLVEPIQAGDRAGHELTVESIGCDVDGWRPTYTPWPAFRDVACWYRDNPRWLNGAQRDASGSTLVPPSAE